MFNISSYGSGCDESSDLSDDDDQIIFPNEQKRCNDDVSSSGIINANSDDGSRGGIINVISDDELSSGVVNEKYPEITLRDNDTRFTEEQSNYIDQNFGMYMIILSLIVNFCFVYIEFSNAYNEEFINPYNDQWDNNGNEDDT